MSDKCEMPKKPLFFHLPVNPSSPTSRNFALLNSSLFFSLQAFRSRLASSMADIRTNLALGSSPCEEGGVKLEGLHPQPSEGGSNTNNPSGRDKIRDINSQEGK